MAGQLAGAWIVDVGADERPGSGVGQTPGYEAGQTPGYEADQTPGYTRLRRRRIILLAVVIVALIGAVGGLLVSTTIKSPADLAAQTRPPGLTQLTATVHRQVISSTVLAQGVVSQPAEVSGPAASG